MEALKQGSRSRCGRFCDSSHAAGDPWKVALLPFLRKLLLKAECESQCIVRCVGKDSSEGWRDRLDGGIREANAEIQPGSYSGRFDILGDSDHLNSDELVSWTGMRQTASRSACRPGAIIK
jgi:hypothetical protein